MAQSRHALATNVLLAEQYRIDTVLGAGGFGITYMAMDVGLGSQVVLKEYFPAQIAVRDQTATVHPHSDRENAIYLWGRERFVREARILDSCRHAHIVRVRRVFEINNTAYMALDFEDGPNLEAWLKTLGRAPTQGEIDAIVWPLLDALAYLHALPQPVIHRDIAPDNIIMRGGNHPVLIDFGAAKVETVGRAESRVSAVKDGYSPREQYSQKGELQGPWTDIYAMAATVRRSITGERPPDSMGRDLEDTMQPMTAMGLEGFRPAFLEAIDEAMRVRHAERPQSVAAWRDMLFEGADEWASRSQAQSRPGAVSRSAPKTSSRALSRPGPKSIPRPVPGGEPPTGPKDNATDTGRRASIAAFDADVARAPAPAARSSQRFLVLGLAGLAVLGAGIAMAQFLRRPVAPPITTAPRDVAVVQPESKPPAKPVTPQPAGSKPAEPAAAPKAPPKPVADSGAATQRAAQECERLAQPTSKGVAGVLFEELDGAAAVAACETANRAAPDNGRLEALLGRALAKAANYGAARQWLERSVAKGDAYAMFHLGALFGDGSGMRRDYAKAREWYDKAAASGEPHALTSLGVLYENGRGVPQDYAKAREFYEKAAAFPFAAAINNLGNLYNTGRGVTQDYPKAAALFEIAAAMNYGTASNNLGFLYENGRGVPQDYGKARELYERSAARNNGLAMNNLGLLYENGRGVTQDVAKAREWYEKSAERGNSRGMLHLGILYANGRGVTQVGRAQRDVGHVQSRPVSRPGPWRRQGPGPGRQLVASSGARGLDECRDSLGRHHVAMDARNRQSRTNGPAGRRVLQRRDQRDLGCRQPGRRQATWRGAELNGGA
jgi:TPR repeat protein/serine/threonine protein kinase